MSPDRCDVEALREGLAPEHVALPDVSPRLIALYERPPSPFGPQLFHVGAAGFTWLTPILPVSPQNT